MTLNQMKYFCTAARAQSITKAAQELYVTQPTVSIAIRELEVELGTVLFYRQGNQLVLTDEAREIYNKCTYILAYCNEMVAESNNQQRERPPVRIGIPPMLSTVFFPHLLDAFQEAHPGLSVRLEEYGSIRACNLVQNDTLDLALVNMEHEEISKFNSKILLQEHLVACVSPKHPLAGRESIRPEELGKTKLILFNSDSVQNRLIRGRFEAEGIKPNIFMRCSQIPTVLKFLEKGDSACFFYSSMVPQFPEVVSIPLTPTIPVQAGYDWKKGTYMRSEAKQFLNFTMDYYAKHPIMTETE
ncbi:MAG: LysR family transcriptional regulator [Oscillospiraceae bacterium]|nr:LysR family transcriptional regulator [Oscillospiraceae bacterium]